MLGRIGRFVRSNIIGFIALFFALGGVAVALPGTNTVDSGDLRPGAVKSVDIRGSAVTGPKLAPSVRPRWARINHTSNSIVRGRGVTGMTSAGNGNYTVSFATPIVNCGWTATLNQNVTGDPHPAGELAVKPAGQNAVNVQYFSSGGSATNLPVAQSGFTVVIHC
jgi:hypothetical protein